MFAMKKYIYLCMLCLVFFSCKKEEFEPGFSYKIVEGALTTAVSFEIIEICICLLLQIAIGSDIQVADWDLGDGGTSSELYPTHEYRNLSGQPKEYLVTLIVKNERGNRREVRQKITISPNATGTATLTLTIKDESGNPVSGATVTIHGEKEPWMNKKKALFDPVLSDANGQVVINNLPEKVIYYNVEKGEPNQR